MPYDPTKPQEDTPLDAAEMRAQLAGLKEEIDTKVPNVDLDNIIVGLTSGPVTAVGLLQLTVSNPPTQAEVQAIANKIDELILALRRT